MSSKPTKRNQISEIAVAPSATAISLSTLGIAGGSIFTNVSTGMADSVIVPFATCAYQVFNLK
jgi:hypothetical protein